MIQTVRFLAALLAMLFFGQSAVAIEKAPAEVVRALGTKRGKSVATGLVFVNGKYLRAPYRVTRAGNQILINDRPVTGQLVAWEEFVKTQPPSKVKVTEVEIPDEPAPVAEPAVPEKDGVDPAAPKDGGDPAAPKDGGDPKGGGDSDLDNLFSQVVRTIEDRRVAADDLDDFNTNDAPEKMKLTDIPPDSDADKARQKRAEDEKKAEEEEEEESSSEESSEKESETANASGKDENGDEVDPASPEGEAAAKAAAEKQPKPAAKKTRKVVTLEGDFELNFQAQKLLKPIDVYRSKLEATLRRGGYLFFGTGAKPYCKGRTSDAATTKELLKKLPELMAKAEDSEGFCDDVRTAGLMSFLNLQIAQDLFRHKVDSVFLKQRRREIAEQEKLNKMMMMR